MTDEKGLNASNRRRRSASKKRSKSHSRAQSSSSKNDTKEHLLKLESKLDRAREVRDGYLDYLKHKYPEWRQSTPSMYKSPPPYQSHVIAPDYTQPPEGYPHSSNGSISRVPRTSILNSLETSQYFWDKGVSSANFGSHQRQNGRERDLLPVHDPIPSSSIYLESDMPRVVSKLDEIRQNLREMREQRLSMPTAEYFRTYAPTQKFHQLPAQRDPIRPSRSGYYGDPKRADIASLAEIRARILNLDINVEKRTREILDGVYKREAKSVEKKELESHKFGENMPDWLKAEESIVEKFEREDEEEVQRLEEIGRSSVKNEEKAESRTSEERKSAQERVQGSSAEDVIAPRRTIVFSNPVRTEPTTPSQPQKQPEPSSRLTAPITPPVQAPQKSSVSGESSYSKMLELLKPTKYQLPESSTSSSDEDVPAAAATTLQTVKSPPSFLADPVRPQLQQQKQQDKPALDFGKSLFQNAPGAGGGNAGSNIGAKMQPATAAVDSDDDFFS